MPRKGLPLLLISRSTATCFNQHTSSLPTRRLVMTLLPIRRSVATCHNQHVTRLLNRNRFQNQTWPPICCWVTTLPPLGRLVTTTGLIIPHFLCQTSLMQSMFMESEPVWLTN